ncbi:hypothetical protein [Alicyclobacillus macrosporangiidus]|uniref:hypothetical protein n=1 Tax=Alicyclobacillus macrosporangiidus TaxID=392015 RepID=UPI0012DC6086|nr:hypothetical protein [Alicyclobacillus macrosporangiidus]
MLLTIISSIYVTFYSNSCRQIERQLVKKLKPAPKDMRFSFASNKKRFPHTIKKLYVLYRNVNDVELALCKQHISLDVEAVESKNVLGFTVFKNATTGAEEFSKFVSPVSFATIIFALVQKLPSSLTNTIQTWLEFAGFLLEVLLPLMAYLYINMALINMFTSIRYFRYKLHLAAIELVESERSAKSPP